MAVHIPSKRKKIRGFKSTREAYMSVSSVAAKKPCVNCNKKKQK